MANILIIYGAKSYPQRATTQDHLYSFRRYSGHRCYYFNMLKLGKPWYRKIPRFIRDTKFDLVILFLDMLNIQWPPYSVEKFARQAGFLQEMQAIKIAMVQDEFYNTDSLDRLICEYRIDHVFSLAAESEWRKIYPTVNFEKVRFHRALPGYLDEKRLAYIRRLAESGNGRPFTIGYRAIKQQNQQWLGRHGFKKIEIAGLFQEQAEKFGLPSDISIRKEDALMGNRWFEFLLRCKYTIAIEGGASILDRDGSLRERTEAYLTQHPEADFDEIEKACFPGRDGELNYMAISPKHLESCATKTCQILVEGDYNGILIPGVHYIELKRDFSNISRVLNDVKQDHLRSQITERAYNDIVESGAYSYRMFVSWVLGLALPDQTGINAYRFKDTLSYTWSRILEVYQWLNLAIMSNSIKIIRRFLPASFEILLRRLFT